MQQPPQSADPVASAQIAYWNDAAAANWTTFQSQIDSIFSPITELAVEAASPRIGERVLDIGSGCGGTVLEFARHVGPTGHVLGIDVSVPMSARARERLAAARAGNADIVVADAATCDLASGDRDLLFSRFGVMFFADPVTALANLRNAMKGTGRLLWVVWRELADSPFFTVPLNAALPLLPVAPAADPHAPGPFAFADADRLQRLLHNAGWRNAWLERRDVPLRLAANDEPEVAAELANWMGPLARRMAANAAGPELHASVRRAIEKVLPAHAGPHGISLVASVWVVSAEV